MEPTYLLEKYVTTAPGEAIRLFPFGRLVKGGKVREITADLARRFKLPHFKPPIKLGSHEDKTPAGGFITGLEVRDDGLYGHIELTEKGMKAIADGDYRYHSPEVIWDDAALEHPETGELLDGPLIVGDALLHTPHLGAAAALYKVESHTTGGKRMSEQTVTLPVSWLDRLFNRQPEPEAEPPQVEQHDASVNADEFAAVQAERDEYAAKIATMEAEAARKARLDHFAAELVDTPLADNADLRNVLADLTDEQAEPIVTQFKALAAQIDETKLTAPVGGAQQQEAGDPVAALNAAVTARAATDKVDYNTALTRVVAEQPDLYRAAYGGD